MQKQRCKLKSRNLVAVCFGPLLLCSLISPWAQGSPLAQGPTAFAQLSLVSAEAPTEASTENIPGEIQPYADAIGALTVFPFKDRKSHLACTAFHIGNGLVLTAGHCFLGATQCNGAVVRFAAVGRDPGGWISPCEEVLASVADDARYLGGHLDFTLFRVKNPPPLALAVERDAQVRVGTPLAMLSFPRQEGKMLPTLHWSGPCNVSHTRAVDFFKRPKPASTFAHTCEAQGGGNGAPLIDVARRKVVGIYQAGFRAPEMEEAQESTDLLAVGSRQRINYAKHIAQTRLADLLRGTSSVAPESIWIGAFASETFPSGLPAGLQLHVATLKPSANHSTVSFSVSNGTDTEVQVIDALGRTSSFKGQSSAAKMGRKTYSAPVRVFALTGQDASTVSAGVEDITSP